MYMCNKCKKKFVLSKKKPTHEVVNGNLYCYKCFKEIKEEIK